MAAFAVFEPPVRTNRPASEHAARFAFLRERFNWAAFLFGPLWMLWRRMWLVLLAYVILLALLEFGLRRLGIGGAARFTVYFLVALLIGVEAASLRRWTLQRKGWRERGVVIADDLEMAERRFFDNWSADKSGHPAAAALCSGVPRQRDRPVSPARRGAVTVAIIDYGSGNLHSAAKAFERAARESGHADGDRRDRRSRGGPHRRSGGAARRRRLRRLPARPRRGARHGRGDDRDGATTRPAVPRHLRRHAASRRARPRVRGDAKASAGSPARCAASSPRDRHLKIPHMGWNTLDETKPHPLFAGIPLGPGGLHAYFVHSYHLDVRDRADLVAAADYGGPVTAFVARDNYAGTQFHPEKSQKLGLALIANFLNWKP